MLPKPIKMPSTVDKLMIVLLFAATLSAAVSFYQKSYQAYESQQEYQSNKKQYQKIKHKHQKLQQLQKNSHDENYLLKVARAKLQYSKPNEIIYSLPNETLNY